MSEASASLEIRVTPRAGRSSIDGWREGVLLVKVTAPPVDSAANDAVIQLLAKALKIPKRNIAIVSGEASRNKRIRVAGLTIEDIRARLGQ